jgi:hypothetical protein
MRSLVLCATLAWACFAVFLVGYYAVACGEDGGFVFATFVMILAGVMDYFWAAFFATLVIAAALVLGFRPLDDGARWRRFRIVAGLALLAAPLVGAVVAAATGAHESCRMTLML